MNPKKKILVLGQTGLLAQAMSRTANNAGYEVFSLSRSQGIDLSATAADQILSDACDRVRPSLIFNAVGITDLHFCEKNPDQAWLLHARLPGLIAAWANRNQCPWVHISTDHYFSDSQNTLHKESDSPSPCNEYASSKLAGETMALTSATALVLRTNIVGKRGWTKQPNFAEWVMNSLRERAPFDAYTDTWASSIEVGLFAHLALKLAESGETGLMNLACSTSISKADWIEKIADRVGVEPKVMRRVKTPSRDLCHLKRANALGLDCTKAQRCLSSLGLSLPTADHVVTALVESFGDSA